ncbi:hypothetical protein [Halomonas rhizosphaerae]|uniref:DUF1311 domain-containing protein n=1 Tax=Halomonas rhizosphaerae TaxID=3043296 RepID=A0ABT6V0Q3_9GAMM|nr:hypothetical protein [Halomonas rhizosphaerae]MDI5891810.1 hypothetical protein [Halomonas rhizosphaerae]
MDPISALFAAVLDSTSGAVSNHMQESLGTEVKTVTVDHNEQLISFQHQLWRIRDESVCVDKRDRMAEFSKCTLAAKKFFADACRYLRENQGSGLKYDKTKNMYCTASSSFKPTIAFVSPASQASPLEMAKRECNRLVIQQSPSAEAREEACARYETLKSQEQ